MGIGGRRCTEAVSPHLRELIVESGTHRDIKTEVENGYLTVVHTSVSALGAKS